MKNINNNPTVINDADFEQKLEEVQLYVNQLEKSVKLAAGGKFKIMHYLKCIHILCDILNILYLRVKGNVPTSDKLDSLQDKIKEIQDLMSQTNNWKATAEENSLQAEKNIMAIEKMNEETSNTLKNAMDYIQTEGAAALEKAISKSEELGQQSDQMSEIAREARTFVER